MIYINFILNDSVFHFPCSRKLLAKIPENKEELFNKLFLDHDYFVHSQVKNEVFQSFLNYWKEDILPKIESDNIMEYFQLNLEFGLLDDYFSIQKNKDPEFNLIFLININQKTNAIKQDAEKEVSTNLDNYLINYADKLALIPIPSLYNIFYHRERNLGDHDEAYRFIIKNASNHDPNFFCLLPSLDGSKFKVLGNKLDSYEKVNDHFGFSPQNVTIAISAFQQQISDLSNHLQSSESEKALLADQVKSLEEKNKSLGDQMTSLEEKNKNLIDQMKSLEEKNKNLIDQMTSLEEKNKSLGDQMTSLEEKNKNLIDQVTSLEEKNKNLDDQMKSLEEKNKNLIDQMKSLEEKNKSLDDQLKSIKQQNNQNKLYMSDKYKFTFYYTGKVQQAKLIAGKYRLEVWGAQGGSYDSAHYGGKGGYSVGEIELSDSTTLYVYVGGRGDDCTKGKTGGWNGGGSVNNSYNISIYGGGGGGATDISLYGSDGSSDWNNTKHLFSRIIVAGGGSSASCGYGHESKNGDAGNSCGGFGGGEVGGGMLPGSQSEAGLNGSFGVGADEGGSGYCPDGAAGGGWYGGGAFGLSGYRKPSGGGSGYVFTSATESNYPKGCLLNSSHYLSNASTRAGNTSFPSISGTGQETGHCGDGAARITPII